MNEMMNTKEVLKAFFSGIRATVYSIMPVSSKAMLVAMALKGW